MRHVHAFVLQTTGATARAVPVVVLFLAIWLAACSGGEEPGRESSASEPTSG